MAVIYSYPRKNDPVGTDTLVISDSEDNNKTKQVTIADIRGATTAGVSSIIAGDNISISPGAGTGDVTITTTEIITADLNGAVLQKVFNNTAGTLSKGQVVYLPGGNNGDIPYADLALANGSATMPALGIVREDIPVSTEGEVVVSGELTGLNLTGFTTGEDLFVSNTVAGALINSSPSGEANLIQKIGKVIKGGNGGALTVLGAFRTNATPNLDEGSIFIGDSSNESSILAIGNSGYVLTSNGSTASWQATASGNGWTTITGTTSNIVASAPSSTAVFAVNADSNFTITGNGTDTLTFQLGTPSQTIKGAVTAIPGPSAVPSRSLTGVWYPVDLVEADPSRLAVYIPQGGTMSSFEIAADSGLAQDVSDGNTLTIAGGTDLNTSVGGTDTVTVNHDTISRSNTSSGSTLNFGQTFDVIDDVSSSAQGHVTGTRSATLTLRDNPVEDVVDWSNKLWLTDFPSSFAIRYQDGGGTAPASVNYARYIVMKTDQIIPDETPYNAKLIYLEFYMATNFGSGNWAAEPPAPENAAFTAAQASAGDLLLAGLPFAPLPDPVPTTLLSPLGTTPTGSCLMNRNDGWINLSYLAPTIGKVYGRGNTVTGAFTGWPSQVIQNYVSLKTISTQNSIVVAQPRAIEARTNILSGHIIYLAGEIPDNTSYTPTGSSGLTG